MGDVGGEGNDAGVAVVAVVVLREGRADAGGPVANADGGEGVGIFAMPGGEVQFGRNGRIRGFLCQL